MALVYGQFKEYAMMSPTIIIGAGNAAVLDSTDSDNIDLVVIPGEERPTVSRPGLRIHSPKSLSQALQGFRVVYGHHSAITSIAGATVLDRHPVENKLENTRNEWSKAIQDYLCQLIQDLGNCAIDTWQGARNTIHNGKIIEKAANSDHFKGSLARVPAICIAAGPSAQQYLERIKGLQESHIIFACDAMLNGCIEAGITPHFTTAVERIPGLHKFFDRHGKCGTTLIAPPVLHPTSFACFDNPPIIWWGADDLYRWISPGIESYACGRSAGTIQVAAALLAGCGPIYLVGHDLAFKDGKSHADSFTRIAAPEAYAKTSSWDYMQMVLDTPGNCGSPVKTTGTWNLFRDDIEHMIADYPDQVVINVNWNEGAVIAGTTHGHLPLPLGGIVMKPVYPASGITDISKRIPSIADDLTRMEHAAKGFADAIESAETVKDLDLIAKGMALGALVSPENVWLFRYCFRNVYHGLMLRLHLRQGGGFDEQKSALQILTRTIPGMCALMREELPCQTRN